MSIYSPSTPRFDSITSRAPRYTSQQTSNAISGFTLIAPSALFSFASLTYGNSVASFGQPVFPDELLRHPLPPPLLDPPPAVLLFPQMRQLRRNARRWKLRHQRQLSHRHPPRILGRLSQHHQQRLPLRPPRLMHPGAHSLIRSPRPPFTRQVLAHRPPPPAAPRPPLRSPLPRHSDPYPRNPRRS